MGMCVGRKEKRYGSKNSLLNARHHSVRLQFDVRVRNNGQFGAVGAGDYL
jgi:hypothetical protein